MNIGKCAGEITKSDQLPDAVRSPIPAIKDEYRFVAARGREADRFSVLVAKREVGSLLSDGENDGEGDCQSMHWFIVWQ